MITVHVHVSSFLLWGLVATAVLTTIKSVSQGMGWSRMSLPFMQGTLFTSNRDRAQAIGFICHFVVGWLFALLYALIFESLHWNTWWLGAGIGLVHGLFVLAAFMPLLPYVHPRMANEYDGPTSIRMLEPPGFMALNYGRRTPLVALIAHMAYGGVMGGFYQVIGG